MYRFKAKTQVSVLEYVLTLTLIYQLGLLTEMLININMYQDFSLYNSDLILNMADNNQANNQNTGQNTNQNQYIRNSPNIVLNDNIPRHHDNPDLSRMIRYLSGNAAALMAANPRNKAVGVFVSNSFNLIADVISNEEKANYWIDQYNHYMKFGRMRGGEKGDGPFERNFNPFNNNFGGPDDNNSSGGSGISSLVDSSNSTDSNFIRNLLSPVDHSIPLDTLINQHFIIILALFFMVLALIIITLYFYLDLIIIFNKDYLLNSVKNKYILMYVKYVLFRTRVYIIFVSILSLSMLIFFAYCLHYLITHPIIVG